MTRRVAGLLLVASLTTASPGNAQDETPLAPSIPSACLESIPDSTLRRVPVYAAPEHLDPEPVAPVVIASMDLFTQSVAEQARRLLGAGASELPPGEPIVTWRQLDHQLRIVAYRDGRVAWRVMPPVWPSQVSMGGAGVRHLGAALDEARRKGELFVWDESLARDSVTWVVRLEPSTVSEAGVVSAPSLRAGFPVFSILTPPVVPPDVERIRTNFPMVRIRGFAGTVRLQFVIDTGGRAIPESVRGVWPPSEPRLVGPPAFAYDSLVRVMRGALTAARFAPGRVGPCVVSQLVQQAFTYRPAR